MFVYFISCFDSNKRHNECRPTFRMFELFKISKNNTYDFGEKTKENWFFLLAT